MATGARCRPACVQRPAQTEARTQPRRFATPEAADRHPQRRFACRRPAVLEVGVGDRRRRRGRCAASEMDEAAVSAGVVVPEGVGEPTNAVPMPRDTVRCGSVMGAAALIAGSAIGGGVLALPSATAQIGLVPATTSLVMVWAYSCAQVSGTACPPATCRLQQPAAVRASSPTPSAREYTPTPRLTYPPQPPPCPQTPCAPYLMRHMASRAAAALGRPAGCTRHAGSTADRDVTNDSS
jgi:hypothetical protein